MLYWIELCTEQIKTAELVERARLCAFMAADVHLWASSGMFVSSCMFRPTCWSRRTFRTWLAVMSISEWHLHCPGTMFSFCCSLLSFLNSQYSLISLYSLPECQSRIVDRFITKDWNIVLPSVVGPFMMRLQHWGPSTFTGGPNLTCAKVSWFGRNNRLPLLGLTADINK